MENAIIPFSFKLITDVIYGSGQIKVLPELISKENFKQIGLIADGGLTKSDKFKELLNIFNQNKINFDLFESNVAEPDYDFLDQFKQKFTSKKYDCLIGIGGGSTLDLTKGIATLLKNDGPAITFKGFPLLKNRPLPIIAIPTTAGTGSDVTFNAVFTDSKTNKRMGINSKYNYPLYAILDPEFTLTCPPAVTVSSGMDALVHTLESFAAKKRTPYSRIFSREAFKLIFNNLWRVLDEPNNLNIRGKLLLGSHYAGVALMNSGAGPSGALTYPLGGKFKVPHGIAGGMFIAKIVKFNVEKGYKEYATLYDLIEENIIEKRSGAEVHHFSPEEKSRKFSKLMDELTGKLNLPTKLSKYGITRDQVDFILEELFGPLKPAMDLNPIEIKREEMEKILQEMF